MKQLTKAQMRIVIVLNVVIVLLLCGLFLIYPLGETPVATPPIDEEHDIYRNSRISLNVDLDFETNIGGSEDEELIACFASPDQTKIHIFGNTLSEDYDYKESGKGIFFITVDRKAKIERISTLGVSGDVLRKVIIAEGGYLLGIDNIQSNTTHLLHVGYDGSLIKKLDHGTSSEESIADLILMENCYMMVIHSGISFINFYDIKVFFYGLDFTQQGTAVLHNASYSQEYLYVLPKGIDKYIMAVNFKSELWNGLTLIEFNQATNQYKKIELENNYEAKGFMPVSGGYVALIIDTAGRASMLMLNSSDLAVREKKYLATGALDAKLFFANSNYYAHIKTSERTATLRFDMAMSAYEDIALFKDAGAVESSYMRTGSVIFACGGGNASLVGISNSQNWFKKFGSSGEETNTKLVFLGNDVFLICESTGKDGDVGGNFGKKDIWLAKVAV